ncbi:MULTISPECIES: hypothetical protein [Streptomyces]|uniref:SnoaL-like domain-containing protein n=1 Tax=Streptomyces hydrogenans TaxID=1873719 RepID=A0ABQ3PRM7_9ACTN|nr:MULTISPECIES: hypothetical protein [Streptomyces]GHG34744.1 hypothetical protein GCM10018784_55270 [Streptomyces hydrogenans]GHI27683.1 hypothetical protein Shyd_90540 [Streptomyces hydrogenans]
MSHGLSEQAAAVLSAMSAEAPAVFAATIETLTAITAAHERGTVPAGASTVDQWGDVYDLDVPGRPVLVEWFAGDAETVTFTRITWLEAGP